MAPGSDDDDNYYQNDAALALPLPLTEEETTTKRQRFTTSRDKHPGTLTSPLLPSSSASHQPPMPDGNAPEAPPPLPTLPLEVIVEILSRLPVKFLLQLRCVCKSWNSLISDPQFAKKHLRMSSLDTQFTHHQLLLSFMNPIPFVIRAYSVNSIFNNLTASATWLNYPLKNRNRFDLIVGSCDGLLCFSINQSCALLWNPSIRKFKKLPSLENERRHGSYTIYGFGYDRSTDSYKVVAIFCYENDSDGASAYKTEVKVHTLGANNSWRRIQEFPSGVPFDESGKFVSGTLNWLATTASRSPWVIISLDLGKESYQELWQPDYGEVVVFTLTLGILRDCLCILSHSNTFSDVWVMKDYGIKESWTKLFRVPYLGSPDSYPYAKALCISENGKILLEFQSKLVLYDSRNTTFEFPEIDNVNGWIVAEVYVESLISPCS